MRLAVIVTPLYTAEIVTVPAETAVTVKVMVVIASRGATVAGTDAARTGTHTDGGASPRARPRSG